MPIEPALAAASEWQISGLDSIEGAASLNDSVAPEAGGAAGADFGGVLSKQLQNLADLQDDASSASADLAAGTASDPSSVVMAVERAQLSMQLASQLRTKGVEAITEIFHTQV